MSLLDEHHETLFKAQEHTVRMMNPDFSEEQILQRCSDLKNQILDAEQNRGISNEVVRKIWEKKSRINKTNKINEPYKSKNHI
jgi:hypothetical protein